MVLLAIKTIKRYAKIYLLLNKYQAMHYFTYRAGLYMGLVVDFGHSLVVIVFYQVLYSNIQEVAGWNYHEMIFLIGLNMLSSFVVLSSVVILNLNMLPEQIKDGKIDLTLTKPLNSLFYITLQRNYIVGYISMLPGFYLMYYGFSNLGYTLSLLNLLSGIVIFCSGYIIAYSILVMFASMSFRFINATTLARLGQRIILEFKMKPHQIFTGGLRILFMFIFPVIFMSSVPAEAIMQGVNVWYVLLSLALAAIFLFLTIKVWNFMIKEYTSAGG